VGRVVVSEFISLDGVVEAPGGEPGYKHTGWVMKFPDEGMLRYKTEEALASEVLLLGRKQYEGFAEAWPERKGMEGEIGAIAHKFNAMPKYVASTTLRDPAWNNTTVLQGDAMAAVRQLKQDVVGMIMVHGSRTLAQSLQQHDLVDEYRLLVFPIILGSGARLFAEADDAASLKLIDMQGLPSGIVILTYEPARAGVAS